MGWGLGIKETKSYGEELYQQGVVQKGLRIWEGKPEGEKIYQERAVRGMTINKE